MSKKHQKYRRYLLNLICKNIKNGRRHKLSITHKLNVIEYVLRKGIPWTSLNKSYFLIEYFVHHYGLLHISSRYYHIFS